jgi:protease YdgD
MFGKRLRGPLVAAACGLATCSSAAAGAMQSAGLHRADVDVSRYPWSAVGKLTNEAGGACSGVVIAADKILTAAHCVFNYRTRRFAPPSALHFLVAYRSGRYAVHARVAAYEIGPGFDPLRYGATSAADWAVLTVTAPLPAAIEPLGLSVDASPRGTPAVLVGYPQDRAHAMTADRDCELREGADRGRFLVHTCRGRKGYSGAPILVRDTSGAVRIAGIQIASARGGGREAMIAVPARAIGRQAPAVASTAAGPPPVPTAAPARPVPEEVPAPVAATAGTWDEAGFEDDIVSSIPARRERPRAATVAAPEFDLFATASP